MNFKHFLSVILIFVLSFGLCSIAFADETAEIPEGYTPIYTAKDMNNIRNDLSGKYVLMNDIDLSAYENWEPIGTNINPFIGILNGNNFTINSLTITIENHNSGNNYYGLFGYSKNAIIENVCIKDVLINIKNLSEEATRGYVGCIVGFGNSTDISGIVVSGKISISNFSYGNIGGIVGYMSGVGTVDFCSNHVEIYAEVNSRGKRLLVGGISGKAASVEKVCSNHTGIVVSGNNVSDDLIAKIGGINGDGSENIGLYDSYNKGEISLDFSTKETFVGGLSGESYATENSYNWGKINFPDIFNGYVGAISGNVNSDVVYIINGPGMKNVYYINDNLNPAYDAKQNFDDLSEDYIDKNYINVKVLSEDEMKQESSFSGFDFESIWMMEEKGHPTHKNTPDFDDNVPDPDPEPDPEPDPQWSILEYIIHMFIVLLNWLKSLLWFL